MIQLTKTSAAPCRSSLMVNHLEIPFSLINEWEEKLISQGKCATFWEIAQWGYKQRLIEEDQFLMQIVPPSEFNESTNV